MGHAGRAGCMPTPPVWASNQGGDRYGSVWARDGQGVDGRCGLQWVREQTSKLQNVDIRLVTHVGPKIPVMLISAQDSMFSLGPVLSY